MKAKDLHTKLKEACIRRGVAFDMSPRTKEERAERSKRIARKMMSKTPFIALGLEELN